MSFDRYIASVSFGKDSLAMVLLILERGLPLDEVVFYDTGMEFKAIYDTRDRVLPILYDHGVKYTELRPPRPFLFDMLEKPVSSKKNGLHYGYSWCGGCARWGTANKTSALDKHAKAAGKNVIQYIGIAADEQKRLQRLPLYKVAPLAKFGFTEADALAYCYDRGFFWEENGIRLYDVMDRVSCWCCANKNLKELRNIRTHLPKYWNRLKDLQSRTDRPMKGPGKSVFDLENASERRRRSDPVPRQEVFRDLRGPALVLLRRRCRAECDKTLPHREAGRHLFPSSPEHRRGRLPSVPVGHVPELGHRPGNDPALGLSV